MSTQTLYPHLTIDPQGVAHIGNTRYKVVQLASEHYYWGWSAEELMHQHPDLRPQEVYAALTYFYDHFDELVAQMQASAAKAEAARAAQPLSRDELLKRKAQMGKLIAMAQRLYMDVHVPAAITEGLRRRGVDVLTAQEDGASRMEDDLLLDRAMHLGRVVFTQDEDFLAIAAERQRNSQSFAGVVYSHQQNAGIGVLVQDLELVAQCASDEEIHNRVLHLPL